MRIYNIISIPKGLQEVECNCQEEYFSGYTAGYEDGKNKGFQSGYTSGVTDGIEEGKEEQKSLMVYTAITENGTYSREDGYNEIFVDVPSYSAETYASGYTDGYESGYTDGSENGFESGYTSGYTDGYGSGYTDGSEDGYGSGYTSGKTDGVAEQKAKLVSTAIISNGTYSREDGFSNVSVNVPQTGHTDEEIAEAFSSGKTAGVDEQKSKLVSTAITANGTYQKEDGYNTITVNVPTGSTINNQTKFVRLYDNGSSAITFDAGYTGLEKVDVEVDVPVMEYWESGYTEGLNYGRTIGYASGYTSGKTDGVAEQKAKLVSTAVTLNGTYSREDGYSSITVNVSSGATINNQTKSITVTTNGSSAITYDAGYTGLERVNVNVNVPTQDYWNMGFESGYTIGTADGVAEQKAKLTSTAFTQNGTYTRADGWSAVTVNVSGYTQQDLDNAFRSGWTNGYNSGYTDGWNAASSGSNTPLTVDVISAGTILWVADAEATPKTIEYQINDGNWTSITATTAGTAINVVAGDEVKFRGNNNSYADYTWTNHIQMLSGKYVIKGNIMSLIDSTGYTSATTFGNRAFKGFFNGSLGLVDASGLLMPATALSQNCYEGMFSGCTSLTSAPALPATTLSNGCYLNMFSDCTSLTRPPVLSATTLAESCCKRMFYGCTSLTTAPELPATTLANECYSNMFWSCTGLTTVPELPATTLASSCYTGMFRACIGLTTAQATLPATTLADGCYDSMFYGCRGLTTAPALPATVLSQYCYSRMFQNCTSLTTAPDLPAPVLANSCYSYMFYGCTNLNYIKCLAINRSGIDCTNVWVMNVSGAGTFVKDHNAAWATGTSGIPNNWTVQDAQ